MHNLLKFGRPVCTLFRGRHRNVNSALAFREYLALPGVSLPATVTALDMEFATHAA
jgi:hypothetical protein